MDIRAQDQNSVHVEKTPWDTLRIVLALISVMAVFLPLAGLGIALSLETQFGMPYAVLIDSPFDLLQLSSKAITMLIIYSGQILRGDWYLYFPMVYAALPVTLFVALGWILIAFIARYGYKHRKKFRPQWRLLKRPLPAHESATFSAIRGFFYGMVIYIGAQAAPLLLVIAIGGAAGVIALTPIMTLRAGELYIHDYVVGPDHCVRKAGRAERMQWKKLREQVKSRSRETKPNHAALCVRIKGENQEIEEGRAVFVTSRNIVLFNPSSGDVTRVPIADAKVTTLNELKD